MTDRSRRTAPRARAYGTRAGWLIAAAVLVASGCASGRAPEDAPVQAAGADTADGAKGAGFARHVDPPVIRVERIGARWGLSLERILSPERRAEVERDLTAIDVERTVRKLAPPGRCTLLFPTPEIVLVVALPCPLRAAPHQPVACFWWDYSGERTPCRVELSTAVPDAAPGEIPPSSAVRRTQGCAHREFTAAPPLGHWRLVVAVHRGDRTVATLDVPLEAIAPPPIPQG